MKITEHLVNRGRLPVLLAAIMLSAFTASTNARAQSSDGLVTHPSAPADAAHPGDVIRIEIWREPDLSGEFTIDESGEVVLPRLGPTQATHLGAGELEAQIAAGYARLLTHTSVDVKLLRRIQVLGAVRQPGLYPVDATMRISDVVALAGGSTPEGNPKHAQLVRDGEIIEGELAMDAVLTETHLRSGDQVFVPERSWLSRHSSLVAAGLSAGAGFLVALLSP